MRDIIERMKSGELIFESDPDYPRLYAMFEQSMSIVGQMNSGYHTAEEIRNYLRELTGSEIDDSVRVFPPFYTAFGKLIRFGRNCFVNFGCTFLDRGGIILEDDVFVGPHVVIATENHPEQPEIRHHVKASPIRIRRNAWIGAGAIILPGTTVGENVIVAAGAIVTKDVPDNVIVAGNPARIMREIKR